MAQYPGVVWNQRPDYLALTQRVDPAGIVSSYNPPRPGVSATDVTSFVYGQATITLGNWPEIMYYLDAPAEWTAFRATARPPQKIDANGQLMVERFPRQGHPPRPLLDFAILPDTICSQEELWWIMLWRRMDPRIRWADILMRIEVPNRTEDSDKRLQNSTNNLINRHEHRRYLMLAWHSTGANGMRRNEVRNTVIRAVNTAQPPLPPNSTRGITPGLINPLLGNVPGNVVPHPPMRNGVSRLRVPALPQITQAAANQALATAAQANPPQPNLAQADPAQNNQGRGTQRRGNRRREKRNRTSPDRQDRPSKRQAQGSTIDDMDDNIDTGSDGNKSSEDVPLSVLRDRAQVAQTRNSKNSKNPRRKANHGVVKTKSKSKVAVTAKKAKKSFAHGQQDRTTESDPEDNEEVNEGGESSAGELYLEGDPGFEAAFQASRRRRPGRQAQDNEQGSRQPSRARPSRRAFSNTPRVDSSDAGLLADTESSTPFRGPPRRVLPTTPPTQRLPRDDASDSELLGDTEGRTLVAPAANTPTRVRRRNVSAITGLPFAGPNRRSEALSGYGDSPMRRRGSPVRSSWTSTRVPSTEDNHERARSSNAANVGLPVAPENRPPQDYYTRSPGGSHHHYTDDSGTPAYVTHPGPSSNSRTGFTPNQQAQTNAQPPHPGANAQPNSQDPANTLSGQVDPTPTNPPPRLRQEMARHDNALIEEIRRRESWAREEYGRLARNIFDMTRGDEPDYATGFLDREMERELRARRERQPSTDDE